MKTLRQLFVENREYLDVAQASEISQVIEICERRRLNHSDSEEGGMVGLLRTNLESAPGAWKARQREQDRRFQKLLSLVGVVIAALGTWFSGFWKGDK